MPESEVPNKLTEWLRGIEAADCKRVEARHMVAGAEGGSTVSTFEPEGDPAHFMVEAIWEKLESDAEAVGGVQRYLLLAYREGQKSPRDRLPVRVDGGADGEVSQSEPASLRGLVSQLMRHNEANMRMAATMMSTTCESMAKQTRALSEALEQSLKEKVEHWRVMSESAKHDREKAELDANLATRAKQQEVLGESVRLLVPGLLGKLGMSSPELKQTAMVRLVESLTDDQRAVIFSTLTPDQQVALGAVLDEAIQTKEGASAQKERPNGQA